MGQFIPLSKFTFGQTDGSTRSPRCEVDRRGGVGSPANPQSPCQGPGILYADIADYARFDEYARNAADSDIALAMLRLESRVSADGGRIAYRDGDQVVALFADGDRALHCAIDLLHSTACRNAGLDRGRRVWFRLAVNLGADAMRRDDGDGIGPAFARTLAMFASARGICVTRLVRTAGVRHGRRRGGALRGRVAALGVPLRALWIDLGSDSGRARLPSGAVNVAAEYS